MGFSSDKGCTEHGQDIAMKTNNIWSKKYKHRHIETIRDYVYHLALLIISMDGYMINT